MKLKLNGKLEIKNFKVEQEMCNTKLRWTIRKEEEEELEDEVDATPEEQQLKSELKKFLLLLSS